MNSKVFSENMKKFRNAKKYTQEYVAERLGVNAQTVSRWECGTTLPDVLMLPEIAELYGIVLDDLFKKHSVAYDNYAQRLSSEYEKTRDPEDFMRCRLEYQKLIREGEMSASDKWNYATIHHFMSRYCKNVAFEWYDKAIAEGPDNDMHIYRRARSLRDKLMFENGRIAEVIQAQKEKCKQLPDNADEWLFLIDAYCLAKEYEEGYKTFKEAAIRFPDNWCIYISGGTACEDLKKYSEALSCYDRAGELGTYFYDDLYCKARLYDNMGEYEKAYKTYLEISEKLRADSYDIESEMALSEARRIKEKIAR